MNSQNKQTNKNYKKHMAKQKRVMGWGVQWVQRSLWVGKAMKKRRLENHINWLEAWREEYITGRNN